MRSILNLIDMLHQAYLLGNFSMKFEVCLVVAIITIDILGTIALVTYWLYYMVKYDSEVDGWCDGDRLIIISPKDIFHGTYDH